VVLQQALQVDKELAASLVFSECSALLSRNWASLYCCASTSYGWVLLTLCMVTAVVQVWHACAWHQEQGGGQHPPQPSVAAAAADQSQRKGEHVQSSHRAGCKLVGVSTIHDREAFVLHNARLLTKSGLSVTAHSVCVNKQKCIVAVVHPATLSTAAAAAVQIKELEKQLAEQQQHTSPTPAAPNANKPNASATVGSSNNTCREHDANQSLTHDTGGVQRMVKAGGGSFKQQMMSKQLAWWQHAAVTVLSVVATMGYMGWEASWRCSSGAMLCAA
jgi:hypothetical protein